MSAGSVGRTVEKEVFIAVSPERAFRAFTDKTELERWFAIEVEIDLRNGGHWHFQWANDAATGTFIEVDPPRRLVMEWHNAAPLGNTICTIEFTPESDGTLIRLRDSGYGQGDDWDAIYDCVNGGWGTALGDLKRWLEDGATDGTFRVS